jgi:hypothetical protein
MHFRPISIACALAVILGAVPASAASGREVTFTLYSANIDNRDTPMLISAAGAVHAIGSATSKDDVKGSHVPLVFTFPGGKIYATARVSFNWIPDQATCTASRHGRGTFTITGGSGIYRGIAGGGHYLETGAAIGVRAPGGGCERRFKLNYVVAHLRGITRL